MEICLLGIVNVVYKQTNKPVRRGDHKCAQTCVDLFCSGMARMHDMMISNNKLQCHFSLDVLF